MSNLLRRRAPLPPPGRDRPPMHAHDRRADARGRHGHHPRPRLARTGADLDLGRAGVPARQARRGLEDTEERLAIAAPALEGLRPWLGEPELAVEVVRVGRVEQPLRRRERPLVDAEADELDPQPAATMLLEHVDVREIRLHVAVRQRAREADLAIFVVEADDTRGGVDQLVLNPTRPPARPVGLLAQVPVHRLAVDPPRVVVELVAVAEIASHAVSVRRRKPPWNSYDATTTARASRAARSPSPSP